MIPRRALQQAALILIVTSGTLNSSSVVRPDEIAPSKTKSLTTQTSIEQLREQRRRFQRQELTTAMPNTWIFNPGDPPRIVWRDVEEVRQLGFKGPLRVRWFNSQLEEVAIPSEPGRWVAWIDGTAPNGFAFRRALTFYARPKNFLMYFAPDLNISLPYFPGPIDAAVWQEHQAEMGQLSAAMLLHAINDSEGGAILIAALADSKPLGRAARFVDSAAVRNQDFHLALKLKVDSLQKRVRALQPPRHLTIAAPNLHTGSFDEAGMASDAKAKIDAVCRAWANDTGEPFVALVARNGVVITHEAFGEAAGNPIDIEYRCWVGSITKSVTALLFSQFLDQGKIDLDDSLASVFPDYPKNNPHVPTFRQCFNHTSGLSGHGDFGGASNPQLENIVLNGIDTNEPNVGYSYSGMGYDLAAKAMEIVAGKSIVRLYNEHLFQPLSFGDVPIGNASSEGQFTAMELGALAQLIANRGSYGELEFISPRTFDRLLPEVLHVRDRGGVVDEGIGLHWIRRLKTGAPPNSNKVEDQIFSIHTIGHGSLSGCIFMIDLDQQLVVTQVRRRTGPRYAEWSEKFFQTIAGTIKPGEAMLTLRDE